MSIPAVKSIPTPNTEDSRLETNSTPTSPREIPSSVMSLQEKWALIRNCDNPDICTLAKKVEDTLVISCQNKGKCPMNLSQSERDVLLESKTEKLFHKLARQFNTSIPSENFILDTYLELQAWKDEALLTFWDKCIAPHLGDAAPQLSNPGKIREWFSIQENIDQLVDIKTVNLSGCGIKVIPEEIGKLTWLTELNLENNKISSLPQRLFVGRSSLRSLKLNNNKIKILPQRLFTSCRMLGSINLKNNKISKLPETIFAGCPNLWELNLCDNKISDFPKHLFAGCYNLEIVYAKGNRLSGLHKGLFGDCSELRELALSKNRINILPAGLFDRCPELELINFEKNMIRGLPQNFLDHCSKLETLKLSWNLIPSLPADIFSQCPKLSHIDLIDNKIEVLSPGLFIANCSQLKHLSLNENLITTVPPNLFANCTNLQTLGFTFNEIPHFPEKLFDDCVNLQDLYLYEMQLVSIPEHFLDKCPKLETIDLGKNRITALPQNFLVNCSNPPLLKIEDNPLMFIPYNDKSDLTSDYVCKKNSEFQSYNCVSNASKFVKLLSLEKHPEVIKKAFFEMINPKDRGLFYEMVYHEACVTTNDSNWGGNHTFDDLNLFCKAAKRAIWTKFDRLSPGDKGKVYGKVYNLAGSPKTNDRRWGENHVFDNMLRLVDAME